MLVGSAACPGQRLEGRTALEFTYLAKDTQATLYGAAKAARGRAFFLRLSVAPDEGALALDTAWGLAGSFVVAEADLALTPTQLMQLLRLQPGQTSVRGLAWVDRGATAAQRVALVYEGSTGGSVVGNASVAMASVVLQLPSATTVTLTDTGLSFDGSDVQLARSDGAGYALGPSGDVTVDLTADAPGSLTFAAQWDAWSLYSLFRDAPGTSPPLGGEIRYFHGDADAGYRQLSYPILPAASSGGAGDPLLYLDVALDPRAPGDATRTSLLLDARTDLDALSANVVRTPAGTPVTLTPLITSATSRAGFWLGTRPGRTGAAAYLAPQGPFAIGFGPGDSRMMCGTNGLEYLTAANGDTVEFVPGQPAYAPAFGAQAAHATGAPLLDGTFTTAWATLVPGGADAARAYFGQPLASVNHQVGVVPSDPPMTLPAAVASRVTQLPDGPTPAFPFALYGAVAPADASGRDELLAFERDVLTVERGTRLRTVTNALGARAGTPTDPPDPVFADAQGTPLAGGATSTPQGFVVELNAGAAGDGPAGTFKQVRFARSGKRLFTFDAPTVGGVVSPWVATSLVKDGLFLVLSDWSTVTVGNRLLSVGGFDFEMSPDAYDPDARQAILVMKFSTTDSLAALVEKTAAWEAKGHFVGDDGQVADAQAVLRQALQIADDAKGQPYDPFGYFRDEVASQPGWTGLLTFNGPINGNGMPDDLKMLYAGIDGKLRAHHFGVELNHVSRATGQADIVDSSLFGVVHYGNATPPPPPTEQAPYVFTVHELDVLIRSSTVREFHAQVWVGVGELFGRDVALTPPAPAPAPEKTIVLLGQYQHTGPVGTVTFTARDAGAFVIDTMGGQASRVLQDVTVDAAALVPVSSVADTKTGGSAVTAQVVLTGRLRFAPAPIPGLDTPDLFSYGTPEGAGLAASGLALTLSFALNGDGQRDPQTPVTITPDLSALLVKDDGAAARKDGLIRNLPVTLKGLLHDETSGLDATALGGKAVNVVALAQANGYVTTAPHYALQLDLPLGSLGALADAHASVDATLVLGWGPSPSGADNDAIGVYVQLPFLSAGALGMNVEGLIKTTFGDANLAEVDVAGRDAVFVLLFNNIALSLMGITFPPRVVCDFILFADPANPGSGNLGWSLAAAERASGAERLLAGSR